MADDMVVRGTSGFGKASALSWGLLDPSEERSIGGIESLRPRCPLDRGECGDAPLMTYSDAGKATGAGLTTGECEPCSSRGMRQPMARNRSSSLSPYKGTRVGRLVVVRSMLSIVVPRLYLLRLMPRSRTNEPKTTAFATAAEARISVDAQTVRYC